MFDTFRSEDRRDFAKYVVTFYDMYGNLTDTGTRVSPGVKVGSIRSAQFNKTRGFKPGRFSLNPFGASSVKCSSSGNTGCILHYSYGATKYVNRVLTGDVMAFLATPTWQYPIRTEVPQYYIDHAVQGAFVKVNAADLDSATLLAEFGETLDSLRHPLKNVRQLLGSFSKKAPKASGPKLFKYLTDAWLEYRYAVMPNVYSAQDIISAWEKRKAQPPSLAKRSRQILVSRSESESTIGTMIEGYYLVYTRKVTLQSSVKTSIYFSATSSWGSAYGLLPQDVFSAIWEVVPYSFVVDWFVGVGDYLRAHRSPPNRQLLGGCVSYNDTYTDTYTPLVFTNEVYQAADQNLPSPLTYSGNTFERVIGVPDLPALPLVNQTWLNVKRSLDSVALLTGRLPRNLFR